MKNARLKRGPDKEDESGVKINEICGGKRRRTTNG